MLLIDPVKNTKRLSDQEHRCDTGRKLSGV